MKLRENPAMKALAFVAAVGGGGAPTPQNAHPNGAAGGGGFRRHSHHGLVSTGELRRSVESGV